MEPLIKTIAIALMACALLLYCVSVGVYVASLYKQSRSLKKQVGANVRWVKKVGEGVV